MTQTCPDIFRSSALILAQNSLFGYYFDESTNVFSICTFDITPANGFESDVHIRTFGDWLSQECYTRSLQLSVHKRYDCHVCTLHVSWFEYEKIGYILAYLLNHTVIAKFTICNFARVVFDRNNLCYPLPCLVLPDFIEQEFVRQHEIQEMDERFLHIWNYATLDGCSFCNKLCMYKRDLEQISVSIDSQNHPLNYLAWSNYMPLESIIEEINHENDSQPFRSNAVLNNDIGTLDKCALCTTNTPDTHVIPCGHKVFCTNCAPRKLSYFIDRTPKYLISSNIMKCPICDHTILSYIRILQR